MPGAEDPAASGEAVEPVFREEHGRATATLIRVLGDFARRGGGRRTPTRPRSSGGRATGCPRTRAGGSRRRPRTGRSIASAARGGSRSRTRSSSAMRSGPPVRGGPARPAENEMAPSRTTASGVFTCCHPALALEAAVTLTLRTSAGSHARDRPRFPRPEATMAQRLVRASGRSATRASLRVPRATGCRTRLDACCGSLYLVFNEGYSATAGEAYPARALHRSDPARAARRRRCCPTSRGVGLLALMLLHDARRLTLERPTGDLVPLEEQDRSRWDAAQIAEGRALVARTLRTGRVGPYQLQAAIAAVHARRDGRRDGLGADRGAVRRLAGVAVAGRRAQPRRRHRAGHGLRSRPGRGRRARRRTALAEYRFFHATRADYLRRLGAAPRRPTRTRGLELARTRRAGIPRAAPRRGPGRSIS